MEPFTMGNGKVLLEMDLAFRPGQMVQDMKESGNTIKSTGGVDFKMLLVILMKENGKMIWQMDMVY